MRMGKNQLFVDFLQDFELKITQCNCSHWPDDSKISLLESGINHTLRNILLSKSLPEDDYTKWVSKVKRVAGRLENSLSYQQKGRSEKKLGTCPNMNLQVKVFMKTHRSEHPQKLMPTEILRWEVSMQ